MKIKWLYLSNKLFNDIQNVSSLNQIFARLDSFFLIKVQNNKKEIIQKSRRIGYLENISPFWKKT